MVSGCAGAQLVVPYDMYAAALCLDGPTLANLELLEGSNGQAEGSLLAALDTCTSPGNSPPPPPPPPSFHTNLCPVLIRHPLVALLPQLHAPLFQSSTISPPPSCASQI